MIDSILSKQSFDIIPVNEANQSSSSINNQNSFDWLNWMKRLNCWISAGAEAEGANNLFFSFQFLQLLKKWRKERLMSGRARAGCLFFSFFSIQQSNSIKMFDWLQLNEEKKGRTAQPQQHNNQHSINFMKLNWIGWLVGCPARFVEFKEFKRRSPRPFNKIDSINFN